jgi:hypothetical protein
MGSWWARFALWPLWAKLLAAVGVIGILAIAAEVTLIVGLVANRAPRTQATPSAQARQQASPTPVTVDIAPSPAASVPASVVPTLSCSIAVSNNGQSGTGGFVHFPGGSFTPDPSSAVTTPNGGSFSLTYVRTQKRWVAVPREWVRPDGRAYAFYDWNASSIESVDIQSGTATALGTANSPASYGRSGGGAWQVIDTERAGVYAAQAQYGPGAPTGLWLFDFSGGARQLAGDYFWQAVGGGAAWGTQTESVPQGASNTLVRLDLGTGAKEDWFSAAGMEARVVGFDFSGHPVVVGQGVDKTAVFLVTGKNTATTLFTAPAPPPQSNPAQQFFVQSVVGDSHGLWLGSSKGIFIYTPAAGWEQASQVAGQLASGCG